MTTTSDIFEFRSLKRESCQEFWICSTENHSRGIDIVQNALEYLKTLDAQSVSIRLFGNTADLDAAATFLSSAAEETICPPLLILSNGAPDNTPLHIQIHAVSKANAKPLFFEDAVVGQVFEDAYTTYYMLNLNPDAPQESGYAQTKNLFEKGHRMLQSVGLGFNSTIRTWLFADDILSWYDELNRARNEFFDKHGIYDQIVPASTGIGAANLSGSAITAQLLAAVPKGSDTVIQIANSPLQSSALDYKSSFSRGIQVLQPDHHRLYVSGTASIDKAGKTVFLDDTPAQTDLTMRVVEGILNDAGMDWSDVVSSQAYLKHDGNFGLFDDYCQSHQIDIPHVKIISDVCRDDLLFELELDAAKIV